MEESEKYCRYEIVTVGNMVHKFCGRYLRELETKNWHYYETDSGEVFHLRKDSIVAVKGGTVEEILSNRR